MAAGAAGAEGGTKRLARMLNIVHNDEIWKDHVRHENNSQRHKWPATWGYLVYEYYKLNRDLEGRPSSPKPPTPKEGPVFTRKLPPIIPERLADFPMTTSREIGWRVTKYGPKMILTGKYGNEARGKCTIIRQLKWPHDGCP